MNPANREELPAIIIIEDDVYMQRVIKHCLRNNFKSVLFNDGLEALRHLKAGNIPDLIITDLNTPALNGMKLLEQVRNSGAFSAIPVVILSGEDDMETKEHCMENGANDYIVKPFNPKDLNDRLNDILNRIDKIIEK